MSRLSSICPAVEKRSSLSVCLHVFKASALGAIPVVVGDDDELDLTFKGIGGSSRPPWLFAPTWEDAAKMVVRMSQNETVARRRAVLRWWIDIVSTIQSMI